MYTLHKEIVVEASVEEAWEFIRNPANLNKITPADMAFKIVTDLPEEMHEGLLVEYRVRIPFMGHCTWLSELKHIVPQHSFVDEQKVGPYSFWYHYHAIEQTDVGVKLIDHVTYDVPFGLLGKLVHTFWIRKTLERVFTYREEQLTRLLTARTI